MSVKQSLVFNCVFPLHIGNPSKSRKETAGGLCMYVSMAGGIRVKTGQLQCQTQVGLKEWDGGVGGVGMDMCVWGGNYTN